MSKFLTDKDRYDMAVQNKAYMESLNKPEETKDTSIQEALDSLKNAGRINAQYNLFKNSVREGLLEESLLRMLNKSTSNIVLEGTDPLKSVLVKSFINENNYNSILSGMRTKSILLSEMYNIIGKYTKKIIEATDATDPDTFKVDPSVLDSFYDELDNAQIDDVADRVRERVSDAIDDFVKVNAENKSKIEDIIDSSVEKINNIQPPIDAGEGTATVDDLKESVNLTAKGKILSVRNNKKSIFEYFVNTIAKTAVTNPQTIDVCLTENKVDMDKVIKYSSIMYSMFEMVNTAKLVDVDSSYIKSTLESL